MGGPPVKCLGPVQPAGTSLRSWQAAGRAREARQASITPDLFIIQPILRNCW